MLLVWAPSTLNILSMSHVVFLVQNMTIPQWCLRPVERAALSKIEASKDVRNSKHRNMKSFEKTGINIRL